MVRDLEPRIPDDSEIGAIGATELGAAAHVAARALHDDPMFVHLADDPDRRRRGMPVYMRASLRATLPGDATYVVRRGGIVCGVASWLPPGRYPPPARRRLLQSIAAVRALSAVPRSLPDAFRVTNAIERVHPHEEHWYLALLGVDPAEQGHGFGAALVQEVLDRDGVRPWPAYLETTNPRNIAWYRRFGFEVEEELRPMAHGPGIWTMRRPPDG